MVEADLLRVVAAAAAGALASFPCRKSLSRNRSWSRGWGAARFALGFGMLVPLQDGTQASAALVFGMGDAMAKGVMNALFPV